ncbi:NAD(P)H-dependent flavin oxidoreductase [Paeniroseomonas aquatica]|uniref:Nitronate monooxygenase n=1 Tax=Paeniroseomonas aquatica TaxID=373043 RepID=A0ABT8AG38_9PROT|nr:nitronate monooxygenase [Paeniroseomonas aquatica]MDN3568653.1 nitronate monooxygenase [Paeniroseomonas aquatica]
MRTALCERLGIEAPIVLAPMGGAVGPALTAAVCNAGGLGMIALWNAPPEALRQQIRQIRALTDRPFGVNLVLAFPQEERLAACLEEGVRIVSSFWGDPASFAAQARAGGATTVIHTVSTAGEARQAVRSGVDVVVAQGWEAGGHVRGTVATLPLVPAVVDAVGPGTPVVAAGGIADGRGLAAALCLGAAGAWIGTRFLASEEATVHARYRELLFGASEDDTVHTGIFDIGWPDAPHRVLRNKTIEAWEAAGRPPFGQRPGEGEVVARSPARGGIQRYRSYTPAADAEGDIDALSLWAGQGVGLVSRLQPAGEILRDILDEARAVLRRWP